MPGDNNKITIKQVLDALTALQSKNASMIKKQKSAILAMNANMKRMHRNTKVDFTTIFAAFNSQQEQIRQLSEKVECLIQQNEDLTKKVTDLESRQVPQLAVRGVGLRILEERHLPEIRSGNQTSPERR